MDFIYCRGIRGAQIQKCESAFCPGQLILTAPAVQALWDGGRIGFDTKLEIPRIGHPNAGSIPKVKHDGVTTTLIFCRRVPAGFRILIKIKRINLAGSNIKQTRGVFGWCGTDGTFLRRNGDCFADWNEDCGNQACCADDLLPSFQL